MTRRGTLLAAVALATTAGAVYTSRQDPAASDRALASVRTAQEHLAVDRPGGSVLYHPGYISRIEVVDARGAREEVYRQSKVYGGPKPTELAVAFRDVALAVFDPGAQILDIAVQTRGGEVWTFVEEGNICPPFCLPGRDSTGLAQPSAAAPFPPPPNSRASERARASVRSAREHQIADPAGRKVLYHPGYISRVEVVNARGVREEVYRQTRVFHGAKPAELALTFRDASFAVFDPSAQILRITVRTKDGEAWTFYEEGARCPPLCPEGDSLNGGKTTPPR